jgi:signal transduction histidine kinase
MARRTLFAGLLFSLAFAAPAPGGAAELRQVEWARPAPAADPAAAMAADEVSWTRFELPLRWSTGEESGLQPIRMRFRFLVRSVPTESWAVLASDTNEGGRLRVNGLMVGEIPATSAERSVAWLRPHLVAIDPLVLHEGENELTLEGAVGPGTHVIGRFEVGPWARLWNSAAIDLFTDYLWVWIGLTVALVMAISGIAAYFLRHMAGAGLLVGTALAWAVHGAALLFEVAPAELRTIVSVCDLAGLGAFAMLFVAGLLRAGGTRRRVEEALLAGYAALGPVLVASANGALDSGAVHAWRLGLAAAVAGASGLVMVRRSRGLAAPGATVLAASVLLAAALLADSLSRLGLLGGSVTMLAAWVAPFVLLALAVPLAEGVQRILVEAENSRDELELRVHEREQLLKRNFERLRESERVKVEVKERQRIMQDMHDGLGSQLMSALMLVERKAVSSDQFAQILRESIDDMRLAIDALAAEEVDLAAALGNLRFRIEPRMRAAGIELHWDARQLPDDVELHPDVVLPILRIVQEALTNALKHSRARLVKVAVAVETTAEASFLDIRVSDNGRGIDGERVGGRGLLNMRNRAQKISAQLRLETARGAGTSIHLRYRVVRAAAGRPATTVLNTQAVLDRVRQG